MGAPADRESTSQRANVISFRRALIQVILRRRGLSPTFMPPISLVLATWSNDYITGLTAFRHLDPADSPERSSAAHTWLRTFAGATLRACNDAQIYATRIDELVSHWRSNLGTVRKGSALDLLIDLLPGVPLVTVESAAWAHRPLRRRHRSSHQPPRRHGNPDTAEHRKTALPDLRSTFRPRTERRGAPQSPDVLTAAVSPIAALRFDIA